MSLYTQLQHAKTEEDVKDACIKALGLKGYTKGLIDIQTREIWFEPKHTGKTSSYAMFTQLLQYLADKPLSPEAQAVLDAGRVLWRAYFAETDMRAVRDEFKLNRPGVGWYQVRNALARRNSSGDTRPIDMKPFETAYQTLTDKLQPQVFSLGFLR
jgi:hypothetical protein